MPIHQEDICNVIIVGESNPHPTTTPAREKDIVAQRLILLIWRNTYLNALSLYHYLLSLVLEMTFRKNKWSFLSTDTFVTPNCPEKYSQFKFVYAFISESSDQIWLLHIRPGRAQRMLSFSIALFKTQSSRSLLTSAKFCKPGSILNAPIAYRKMTRTHWHFHCSLYIFPYLVLRLIQNLFALWAPQQEWLRGNDVSKIYRCPFCSARPFYAIDLLIVLCTAFWKRKLGNTRTHMI